MLGMSQLCSHMLHALGTFGSPQYTREMGGTTLTEGRGQAGWKLLSDTMRLRMSNLVSEWRAGELEEYNCRFTTTNSTEVLMQDPYRPSLLAQHILRLCRK